MPCLEAEPESPAAVLACVHLIIVLAHPLVLPLAPHPVTGSHVSLPALQQGIPVSLDVILCNCCCCDAMQQQLRSASMHIGRARA